jgi:hypothetical protein
VKAHPSKRVSTIQFWVNTTNYEDQESIYPAAAHFHAQYSQWSDKGLGAYYWVYPNAFSVFLIYHGEDASNQWMWKNLRPMLTNLTTFPGLNKDTSIYLPSEFSNFWTFFQTIWGDMPASAAAPVVPRDAQMLNSPFSASLDKRHGPGDGKMTEPRGIVYLDSWLLGKKHLHDPKFAAVLKASMPKLPGANLGGQFIGGGKVIELGENDTTAVLPAWRKAYVHLILYGYGKPSSLPLREFAPDMGAYVNEAYPATHLNWQSTYWGTNYPRLSALKKKYDPTSLFWQTPGIDADDWIAGPDGRLCRNVLLQNATLSYSPLSDNHNDGDPHLIDEFAGPRFPYRRGMNGSVVLNPRAFKSKAGV